MCRRRCRGSPAHAEFIGWRGDAGRDRACSAKRHGAEHESRHCARGDSRSTNLGGAGEGNRTLVVSLGSFLSAIEIHPRRTAFYGGSPIPRKSTISSSLVPIPGSLPFAWPAATSKAWLETASASFGVNAIGQYLRLVRQQWRRLPTFGSGDRSTVVDPLQPAVLWGSGRIRRSLQRL